MYYSAADYKDERTGLSYKGIFKYNPIDGKTTQISTSPADEINIINNSIYYTSRSNSYTNNYNLHRLRIDGLFDISLCNNICSGSSVIGNCIYFTPANTDSMELHRINSDGSNMINISSYFKS
ncbi:MAG: DUF5050 domain-containing protein [Bacillota bacterium]|nr:DUF5050 domain-containing protein [Bacillota bacterium]